MCVALFSVTFAKWSATNPDAVVQNNSVGLFYKDYEKDTTNVARSVSADTTNDGHTYSNYVCVQCKQNAPVTEFSAKLTFGATNFSQDSKVTSVTVSRTPTDGVDGVPISGSDTPMTVNGLTSDTTLSTLNTVYVTLDFGAGVNQFYALNLTIATDSAATFTLTATVTSAEVVDEYMVTFNPNAPTADHTVDMTGIVTPQTVTSGETVSTPDSEPTLAHHIFGGWYGNADCSGTQYDFATPVTADLDLYAKWTLISSELDEGVYIYREPTAAEGDTALDEQTKFEDAFTKLGDVAYGENGKFDAQSISVQVTANGTDEFVLLHIPARSKLSPETYTGSDTVTPQSQTITAPALDEFDTAQNYAAVSGDKVTVNGVSGKAQSYRVMAYKATGDGAYSNIEVEPIAATGVTTDITVDNIGTGYYAYGSFSDFELLECNMLNQSHFEGIYDHQAGVSFNGYAGDLYNIAHVSNKDGKVYIDRYTQDKAVLENNTDYIGYDKFKEAVYDLNPGLLNRFIITSNQYFNITNADIPQLSYRTDIFGDNSRYLRTFTKTKSDANLYFLDIENAADEAVTDATAYRNSLVITHTGQVTKYVRLVDNTKYLSETATQDIEYMISGIKLNTGDKLSFRLNGSGSNLSFWSDAASDGISELGKQTSTITTTGTGIYQFYVKHYKDTDNWVVTASFMDLASDIVSITIGSTDDSMMSSIDLNPHTNVTTGAGIKSWFNFSTPSSYKILPTGTANGMWEATIEGPPEASVIAKRTFKSAGNSVKYTMGSGDATTVSTAAITSNAVSLYTRDPSSGTATNKIAAGTDFMIYIAGKPVTTNITSDSTSARITHTTGSKKYTIVNVPTKVNGKFNLQYASAGITAEFVGGAAAYDSSYIGSSGSGHDGYYLYGTFTGYQTYPSNKLTASNYFWTGTASYAITASDVASNPLLTKADEFKYVRVGSSDGTKDFYGYNSANKVPTVNWASGDNMTVTSTSFSIDEVIIKTNENANSDSNWIYPYTAKSDTIRIIFDAKKSGSGGSGTAGPSTWGSFKTDTVRIHAWGTKGSNVVYNDNNVWNSRPKMYKVGTGQNLKYYYDLPKHDFASITNTQGCIITFTNNTSDNCQSTNIEAQWVDTTNKKYTHGYAYTFCWKWWKDNDENKYPNWDWERVSTVAM